MELVSVVVATHRRDAELRRALTSLARQSYPSVELILVDDNGDPDWNRRVAQILADFRAECPAMAVRLIVDPVGLGSAGARNAGIAVASGRYTTFLDDDDEYLPDKLARQVSFMEREACDYSITDLKLYNASGRQVGRRTRAYLLEGASGSWQLCHLKYHLTGTGTLMFRTDFLRRLGGFGPRDIGDEYYLVQKAIDAGGRLGYLPVCDLKAYVHEGGTGLSAGASRVQGERALYAYKRTYMTGLRCRDRRYIRMRHYAVLALAFFRTRRYGLFLLYGCLAILTAPVSCVGMLFDLKASG